MFVMTINTTKPKIIVSSFTVLFYVNFTAGTGQSIRQLENQSFQTFLIPTFSIFGEKFMTRRLELYIIILSVGMAVSSYPVCSTLAVISAQKEPPVRTQECLYRYVFAFYVLLLIYSSSTTQGWVPNHVSHTRQFRIKQYVGNWWGLNLEPRLTWSWSLYTAAMVLMLEDCYSVSLLIEQAHFQKLKT